MLETIVITTIAALVLVVGVLVIRKLTFATATRVLEKDPDNVKALEKLIRLHLKKGEQAEAIEKLERLLRLKPEDLDGLLLLATIRYRRKEYDLADPHFKKLFDEELLTDKKAKRLYIKSDDYVDVLTMAYLFQGHRLLQDGHPEAAEAFKKKARKYSNNIVKELALY